MDILLLSEWKDESKSKYKRGEYQINFHDHVQAETSTGGVDQGEWLHENCQEEIKYDNLVSFEGVSPTTALSSNQ